MTPQDLKAIRLVLEGRVRVAYRSADVLAGDVEGDTGQYRVSIDPDGHHCDCMYGVEHGGRHAHTIALWEAARREAYEGVLV